MTSHDQLSKSLITIFFPDFLRLLAPELASRLKTGEATFLDKEVFTDWPVSGRREMDLLAKVRMDQEELPLLIHVEIETEFRSGMKGVEGTATAVFRYRVLGLSGCRADEWLSKPEPIAWAFAALMRPGDWSRAELKLGCLRRIAASEVSGLGKQILLDWVETYVQLTEQDVVPSIADL